MCITKVFSALCILCFTTATIHSQRTIDSLKLELNQSLVDTAFIKVQFDLTEEYWLYHEDSLDLAIYHGKQALNRAKKIKNYRWEGSIYNLLAKIYNIQEELDLALETFQNAMAASLNIPDSLRYMMYYDNSSNVLIDQGKFDEGLKIKQIAVDYFKKNAKPRTISASLFGIAWLYMEKREYEKSIPFFKQSIEYAPDWDLLMAEVNGNLATIYREINVVDSALHYFKRSALLSKDVPSIYTLNIHEYALLKEKVGELDSAKYYLDIVLNAGGQDQNSESFAIYQLNYARVLAKLGMPLIADTYYTKGKKIIGQSDNQKNLSILYNAGYFINKSKGDFKNALENYVAAQEIKDSLQTADLENSFKEIETKYETEKKEQEIIRLGYEDKIKQAQLANQKNWIIGLIAGLGLLLFMLQRIFGQNTKINAQKESLSKALNDKNILLKEIHHRVKNNLQVVSSLLSLQSRYVEDSNAKEAINTGKARVQSMSLLHQNLYRNDDLKTVNIKKYFEDLGQNLFDNYRLNEKDITFHSDIADLELDIDVVVPMGLITNELISNSLKHAFVDRKVGDIWLSVKKVNGLLQLSVKDNGSGLPFTVIPEESDSLGMQLISSFADKLDAKIEITNDSGSSISMTFDPTNLALAA